MPRYTGDVWLLANPHQKNPAVVDVYPDRVEVFIRGASVGRWPRSDVAITDIGSHFELQAEGETLGFSTTQAQALRAALAGAGSGGLAGRVAQAQAGPTTSIQAPPKKRSTGRWLLIILGSIFLFAVCVSAIGGNLDDASSGASPTARRTTTTAAPERITAIDLSAAYDANEVAADRRYGGRVMIITGEVENIGLDILDTPYVTLATGQFFSSVQCMFEDGGDVLSQLSQGQAIAVEGRITSGGQLFNVLVRDCRLR